MANDSSEMKLGISSARGGGAPPPRRSRSRLRGEAAGGGGRKQHRSSPSPTSIVVDFDDFCDTLKGDANGTVWGGASGRRRRSRSRRGSAGTVKSREEEKEEGRGIVIENEPPVGGALRQMGRAKARIGKWSEALKLYEEALLAQADALGRDHEEVGRTLIERGTAHAMMGSWYDSILDLERGLHIQRRAARVQRGGVGGKEEGPEIAETLIRVGQVQHKQGNYVESVGSLRGALVILRGVNGESGRRAAAVSGIIATSQHQRRRYGEAIESYRDCLLAYKAAGAAKNHPDVAWVRRRLADRTMFATCVADFWDDSAAV